jgi:hypothetical protein
MNEETKKNSNKKISKHEFYFETPLYASTNIEELEAALFEGDVDAYSAKNGIETTYEIHNTRVGDYYSDFYSYLKVSLKCKRKNNDILKYFVLLEKNAVIKVGQDPSLADIQFAEIGKKYDKYLSREDLKEFKRAIGLAANGVGVGSFVYLRRIFEKLISQTFNENKDNIACLPEQFITKRMVEKVEILKQFLPKQLVEMKLIYTILSQGVHELSEEECLSYFPALKLSIELILEEQIEIEKENARQKEVTQTILKITQDLKNKNEK